MTAEFSTRLLAWWDRHGRHDLPWQRDGSAYAVWISEIMLQQTQVTTVIPYFQAFMRRFPDVATLAAASEDEVLHHWSGLGYYARARNLHRAARVMQAEHGGHVPGDFAALEALPGIGRSTAGAVMAQAFGERHAILDGNVKRVLARYHAVEGWPGRSAVLRMLWKHSEAHTPSDRVADYTQAIMDLGATVCRRRPLCESCPLVDDCRARIQGRQTELPEPRPKRTRPTRETTMVLATDPAGRILLERRPSEGLWGGLWSLPEVASPEDVEAWCLDRFGEPPASRNVLPTVSHGFTHFELRITPVVARLARAPGVMEGGSRVWYNGDPAGRLGLAAVVRRLLDEQVKPDPVGADAERARRAEQ